MMLLVMGLGYQLVHWPDDFCRQLSAEGFRVVRFDNRDAGHSTHLPGRSYHLEDMPDDAVGLLGALGVEDANVVGASLGAMVAHTMAIRHPDRVHSLASLMSTTGRAGVGRTSLRVYRHLLSRRPRTELQAVERRVRVFASIGSPGFKQDLDELRSVTAVPFGRDPDARAGRRRQYRAVRAAGAGLRRCVSSPLPPPSCTAPRTGCVTHPAGVRPLMRCPARLELITGMGHDLPPGAWPQLIAAIAGNACRTEAS